jgi:PKD domain
MRRLVLLLLSLLILTAAPASALADDQLLIEPEGGDAITLAISGLGEPDVVARPYTLPGAPAPVPITGYSLDRVLQAAGIDPSEFGSLEIQGTSGTVALTRDEATGRTTFPEGPPVFYAENGDARFLRPGRTAGEPAEHSSGGPMTVRIAARSDLRLTVKASPRKAEVNELVRFTATVRGAEAGETVEISWRFGDGRRREGSKVTHRFRRPGNYDVTVTARRSGEEIAADDVVTVQVGNAPDETDPEATDPDSGGTGVGGGGTAAPVTPSTPSIPSTPSPPSTTYDPVDEPPQPSPAPGDGQNPVDADGQGSDGLESVEGIELADLAVLSSEAGRDAVNALRPDDPESDGGVPDGVWWFLATSGLLGLGGLLELSRRPGR